MLLQELESNTIKLDVPEEGEKIVLDPKVFKRLLFAAISTIDVDDLWYTTRYPDVYDAIASNIVESARLHFVNHGYFEGRMPREVKVDEQFYLNSNFDVADEIVSGTFKDAQDHFEARGFLEGRLPYKGFSLFPSDALVPGLLP